VVNIVVGMEEGEEQVALQVWRVWQDRQLEWEVNMGVVWGVMAWAVMGVKAWVEEFPEWEELGVEARCPRKLKKPPSMEYP